MTKKGSNPKIEEDINTKVKYFTQIHRLQKPITLDIRLVETLIETFIYEALKYNKIVKQKLLEILLNHP